MVSPWSQLFVHGWVDIVFYMMRQDHTTAWRKKKTCCWMQLPKLIIIRVNKYSCKYSLDDYHYELGLLVNWKRTAYQFQINRPAYSQPSLKRREEEKIRIKDEKRRLHFVSPPKYPLDREGSMIWNWTFPAATIRWEQKKCFYVQGKSVTSRDII